MKSKLRRTGWRVGLVCCCLLTWLAATIPSRAADPSYYKKKDNWHDTLLTALEGIDQSNLEDGFAPFESGVMRGGEAPRHVRMAVAPGKELYLLVTGSPNVKWGLGDWADAKLILANGQPVQVSRIQDLRVLYGRCEKDLTLRSGLDQKMRLGGQSFESGLNMQANAVVLVPLPGSAVGFEAWIGVDAWAGANGSVRFSAVGARTAARKRLFELLIRDFPEAEPRQQMAWEREDAIHDAAWKPGDYRGLALRYAQAAWRVPPLAEQAAALASDSRGRAALDRVRALYYESRRLAEALERAAKFDFDGVLLAVRDLEQSHPATYPKRFLPRLKEIEREIALARSGFQTNRLEDFQRVRLLQEELEKLKDQALRANPLLDFDHLLVLKRQPLGDPRRSQWEGFGLGEYLGLPRQSSWANGTMPNVDRWTNEIACLSPPQPRGSLKTVFRPERSHLILDLDLHWNARRMLFSMPDTNRNWQIHELNLSNSVEGPAAASPPAQLTPSLHTDVHNYNGIYLPDGRIDFISTAPLQGVPCNASVIVGMMYQMAGTGRNIRQLCFEQDHDYTPSVLNDGRVLYLRWDYTDTPHVWNRLLMAMNPDGTGQMEYYGANSYWPNAVFFARAIPRHETKIVGIVTGHHEGRVGELVVFDPAKGRHEANGVVQRIPGRGRPVEPRIEDKLTEHSWPKFLHPWPLSENYFLVACKPEPDSLWGIYLVDVFDNMVLIKEEEHFALLQPIPFKERPTPPVIQNKTQPRTDDALAYMEDVYSGPGLRGLPPGTVKRLRLFTYHFGYQTLAGIDHRVGADGPWEAKRVLGTVPVEADGSAFFRVPAKTPISFQPLDAQGRAVALMRSWMTAMPGESVSCVGCHDRQSAAPLGAARRLALAREPSPIEPWHGPPRGFSFIHEVQPVLDKYCVACHNSRARPDGRRLLDLERDQGGYLVYRGGEIDGKLMKGAKRELLGKYGAVFDPSYVALRQYVRVGGLESDLHLLPPMEFHADTSELIRMLTKGHHNVKLDGEAWDRLLTWIDLNAPCHGRWSDVTRLPPNQCQRRIELRKLYGGPADNGEASLEVDTDFELPKPILPEEPTLSKDNVHVSGWPMSPGEAARRQSEKGPASRWIDLGGGVRMEFLRIPAGDFVMGDQDGDADERPRTAVRIGRPFWMAKFEISNAQFAQFDPSHDSRFEHRTSWIFSEEYLGWPLNAPDQPVVRVSWNEAMAFCAWLSRRIGESANLPTEAQWEYACRAGAATPLSYGNIDTDFSSHANLGDSSLRRLASEGWRPKAPDLVPRDSRFNDGALVTAKVGSYQPNAWGLHDMHGNATEWTRSVYRPYPYAPGDGREQPGAEGQRVARGGSWRDRPKYARSATRFAYEPWQKVFNVGFRVIIEENANKLAAQ